MLNQMKIDKNKVVINTIIKSINKIKLSQNGQAENKKSHLSND